MDEKQPTGPKVF